MKILSFQVNKFSNYALFTTVFFGAFNARVAFDVATPVERAPTLFGLGKLVRVIPASAAHQITAIRTYMEFQRD